VDEWKRERYIANERGRKKVERVKIGDTIGENILLQSPHFFSKLFPREFGLNVPKFAIRTIICSGIPAAVRWTERESGSIDPARES